MCTLCTHKPSVYLIVFHSSAFRHSTLSFTIPLHSRGDDVSDRDPGWRRPVIKLVLDQARSTLDQLTLVPYGVSYKRLTSCQFSSTAEEISSFSDYQKTLSHEATAGGNFVFFSFSVSVKSKSFRQNQEKSKQSTFESKAECAEVKMSLEKYFDHQPEGKQ